MPEKVDKLFGQIAIDLGLITKDQLADALREQPRYEARKIGCILVGHGRISDKNVAEIISLQRGIELVDLRQLAPAAEAIEAFDGGVALLYRAVPIAISDGCLRLAVCPFHNYTEEIIADNVGNLSRLFERPIGLVFALPEQITEALASIYPDAAKAVLAADGDYTVEYQPNPRAEVDADAETDPEFCPIVGDRMAQLERLVRSLQERIETLESKSGR